MILTATSCIEGSAILQHHDLVTAEAIVDGGIEHQARQRGGRTEQDDLLRTQPPEVARTALNASRERGGTQPDTASRGAPSGGPSTPASAHTAARIHRNPGRRPLRTHRQRQPRATRQYAARATAPSSRLPAAPERNPEQAKNVPPAGNQTRLYCV